MSQTLIAVSAEVFKRGEAFELVCLEAEALPGRFVKFWVRVEDQWPADALIRRGRLGADVSAGVGGVGAEASR